MFGTMIWCLNFNAKWMAAMLYTVACKNWKQYPKTILKSWFKILGFRTLCLPSDTSNPIMFRRKQFPIKPCYAMTIDRSQGQTLDIVGVDLRNSCFNSGQLCVALSRTRSPSNIAVLLPEGTKTPNPVYTECIQDWFYNNIQTQNIIIY